VFYPILQVPTTSTVLAARTSLPPGEIITEMRQAISRVDAGIPLFSVSSWTDSLGFVLLPGRAVASALAVFGVIAILLAVTGIFGLASNTVRKRLRDVAIRIALGGRPIQIARILLMRTAILLAAGSTTGFLLGYAVSKMIAGIVYQANPNVGWVLMMVVTAMFVAGAIAVFLPLKRALAARPMDLLRAE
jgi:ABC-type antimicrobial peptide transport system permease subunit